VLHLDPKTDHLKETAMMATLHTPPIGLLPARSTTGKAIIGAEGALRHVLEAVRMVAPTNATVLIAGETGTGKELIARAIHDQGARSNSAYVRVNCAVMPAGLLESELFGHERGAFTGACTQTIGRFQLANHGALFLDEVGDLPLELQPKLLRVLQEQEFERLGSSRTIRVNVRVVAATNRNLSKMVRDGQFRADLFFRLNVFPIAIPPLRERPEDIPDLVRYFVEKLGREMRKDVRVSGTTMRLFQRHNWPGNVRELQNVIEREMIMCTGSTLNIGGLGQMTECEEPSSGGTLAEAQRNCIVATLDQVDWVIAGPRGAAAKLGLPRTTLMYRMSKLGIARKNQVPVIL
jgi:formate hydrogenlyase transcriptional activator